MKSYRIWLSIAAILFIGKMFGTVWTQAEDLGGFDVSVSEGKTGRYRTIGRKILLDGKKRQISKALQNRKTNHLSRAIR